MGNTDPQYYVLRIKVKLYEIFAHKFLPFRLVMVR